MTENLVVRSKIKDYIKDMNVSGDFSEGLSNRCYVQYYSAPCFV